MKIIKNNFLVSFLLLYFLVGSFYSLETGISHDEYHEQKNWEYNVALIKSILFNSKLEPIFENYTDKYYGIGFQLISQPIQLIIKNLIFIFQDVDIYGAHLIAKHFVVFLSFFISGIFFYLIISKISNNKIFSIFAVILYLSYPYLLGHAFFNPKDIPFLCFWIICTYCSFNIFDKLLNDIYPNYGEIILFSILNALLLSTRLTGILIFIQYIITFAIFINFHKLDWKSFFKITFKKILLFIFLLLFFVYLFYPVFWMNPLSIFTAINYMSYYYHDVCTLTLGKCMHAKNLDPTYIPIWLLVKLPIIILIGLILLPFTEKKIFENKRSKIFFGSILFTSFVIPILLILMKTHLYDEVRHILFLFPFIFLIGLVSLYYFSKNIFYILSSFTLGLFFLENIKIYPYQYVWFNTPSRIMNISDNFELDYWGLSGRELAKKVSNLDKKEVLGTCILVSPLWSVKPFLDPNLFNCFKSWGSIDAEVNRPFWAIQHVRNLKKGRSYNCDSVYEENFKLLFYKKKITTGRLIKCS